MFMYENGVYISIISAFVFVETVGTNQSSLLFCRNQRGFSVSFFLCKYSRTATLSASRNVIFGSLNVRTRVVRANVQACTEPYVRT